MTDYVALIVVGVGLLQFGIAWQLLRIARSHRTVSERLTHFADALGLLTETTEAGFRAVVLELGRVSETGVGAPMRPTTGRVARLARRGRSVQQIASDEQVSEGEVRLRLRLADVSQARLRSGPGVEGDHGALRAD
jgi:hypothetical protein